MQTYRKHYSAAIPEGAERVRTKVKRKEYPAVKTKAGTFRLNKAGTRMRVPSPCWYGRVDGKDVKLFENREASKSRLLELLAKHERGQTPLVVGDASRAPLAGHLEDWREHLSAKESTPKHVRHFVESVRRVIEACGFGKPTDLDLDAVRRHLSDLKRGRAPAQLPDGKDEFTRAELSGLLGIKLQSVSALVSRHKLPAIGRTSARLFPRATAEQLCALRSKGASPKTVRDYIAALRSFARWLVDDDRLGKNPFAKLKPGKAPTGERHKRRPLTRAELQRLLATTRASGRISRKMSGEDRFWLYVIATCTGFRARELWSLTPRSFALNAVRPVVHLRAEHSKNGKGAEQPLPAVILGELRDYLATKPPPCPVWPGTWIVGPVEMLRPDLAAAGIPYVVEGPGGVPLFADMHSMRHTFIRMLDLAGTSLKEAMQLARHSDPKLTMAVYGQAGAEDLAAKVNAVGADCFPLASFLLPFPAATG